MLAPHLPDAIQPAGDRRDRQTARIAWHYYMEGLTQSEVAQRVGISRMMVNRVLAQCRADGLVQIRMNVPFARCVELEANLVRAFGLKDAVVSPSPAPGGDLSAILGAEAGTYLCDHLQPGQSVGLGWGRALWSSLRSIRRRAVPGLSVVSLLGGLTRRASVNTYECASRLADILTAECYYLAAPTLVDTDETRAALLAQDVIQEVLQRGRTCDLALVSVGDLERDATIRTLGLVTEADQRSLRAAGAVGDLLCSFIDATGAVVDHPLNRRVIALPLRDLARIPTVILVAGGAAKTAVTAGALRAGYAHVLITDEESAAALLRRTATGPAAFDVPP